MSIIIALSLIAMTPGRPDKQTCERLYSQQMTTCGLPRVPCRVRHNKDEGMDDCPEHRVEGEGISPTLTPWCDAKIPFSMM